MKTDIHPKYEKTVIKCACGNEIETRSTVFPEMHVELCSACHPFFTGKQKFVDTAGRVDKFRARMEKAKTKVTEKQNNQKTEQPKKVKDSTEKLKALKEEMTVKSQSEHQDAPNSAKAEFTRQTGGLGMPGEVGQIETSDEELVADSELAKGSELAESTESAAADELADKSAEHKPENQ